MKGTITVNSTVKTAVFWVVMLCTAILLWRVVQTGTAAGEKRLTFTEFYKEVQSGNVESVTITNSVQVAGKFRSGSETLKTVLPSDYPDIIKRSARKRRDYRGQGIEYAGLAELPDQRPRLSCCCLVFGSS